MKPIAIFYHCLFYRTNPFQLLPNAMAIVEEQMRIIEMSGLLQTTSFFLAGINGSSESLHPALEILPQNSAMLFHGLDCKSENMTILALERWLLNHPDWYVLYLHSKGATHPPNDDKSVRWRNCMMRNLVTEWVRCVADLKAGYDSVGCHWTGPLKKFNPPQSLWGGNFWWAKSNFLLTLPSIQSRPQIKQSGLGAIESRYEAEIWIGNGPRLPRVKDYHHAWPPNTCQ